MYKVAFVYIFLFLELTLAKSQVSIVGFEYVGKDGSIDNFVFREYINDSVIVENYINLFFKTYYTDTFIIKNNVWYKLYNNNVSELFSEDIFSKKTNITMFVHPDENFIKRLYYDIYRNTANWRKDSSNLEIKNEFSLISSTYDSLVDANLYTFSIFCNWSNCIYNEGSLLQFDLRIGCVWYSEGEGGLNSFKIRNWRILQGNNDLAKKHTEIFNRYYK